MKGCFLLNLTQCRSPQKAPAIPSFGQTTHSFPSQKCRNRLTKENHNEYRWLGEIDSYLRICLLVCRSCRARVASVGSTRWHLCSGTSPTDRGLLNPRDTTFVSCSLKTVGQGTT